MNTIRQDRESQAVKDQHTENLTTYHEWIKTHPSIRDCIATFNAFTEYMEGEDIWTEADLDYALSQIPEARIVRQRVKSQAEIVEAENSRRKSLSRDELGELARAEHPAPVAPTLPTEWIPRGRKKPIDISTREALLALVKSDYNTFKELNQRFGSELINQRLGVKPAAKTGVSVRLPI